MAWVIVSLQGEVLAKVFAIIFPARTERQETLFQHNCLAIIPPECASFKAELYQRGIWNIDAENAVADGIRMVSTMMSLKRLRVHRRCTNLLERIPAYVWDPNKAKRGLEEPIKANDDEVDAMRYGTATKIAPWRLAA